MSMATSPTNDFMFPEAAAWIAIAPPILYAANRKKKVNNTQKMVKFV